MPARFVTLGCKVNQYETQYVRELLEANGYREATSDEPAVLAVVNTCTVTAEGDSKSRQVIRQLAKRNPGIRIIVMGCYATADPDSVGKLPAVAAVITDKRKLADTFEQFGAVNRIRGIRSFRGRCRAFVKVQDGCILDCTFCIIPKVRPGLVSRPVEEIADEVRNLVDAGFRELVLTGIHLGHYGIDLCQGRPRSDWRRLWHLLDRIANLPGEFRIRLSSLEATEVTDDFVRVLADYEERICPHLHLSLQSGSDRILQRMRRRYRIGRFLGHCDRLRDRLDTPALTTDIIVGFPSETEQDFQATLTAATRAGFTRIHIFPFSARKGTEAALISDVVPAPIIEDRRQRLAEVERELARAYHQQLIGRQLGMLVEAGSEPGFAHGTACRYAPLKIELATAVRPGELLAVRALAVHAGRILVERAD